MRVSCGHCGFDNNPHRLISNGHMNLVRGVASIWLSGLEPLLCLPTVGLSTTTVDVLFISSLG